MQRNVPLLLLSMVLLALPSSGLQSSLGDGQAIMQAGDLSGAEEIFRSLTEANPANGQAWFFLGFALHGQKKLGPALEAHRRAAEFPGLKATASYNAACVLSLQGDVDEAFVWLDKARQAGFTNVAQLSVDADLANLRADPRFTAYVPRKLEGNLEAQHLFVEEPNVLLTLEEAAGDEFGWVARNVGDLDADGIDDFVTSAPSKALGAPRPVASTPTRARQENSCSPGTANPVSGSGTAWLPQGTSTMTGRPMCSSGRPAGQPARGTPTCIRARMAWPC